MSVQRLVITQGQQAVSAHPDMVFSTLLGSCVAVCLWDAQTQIGGMNHILLASQRGAATLCDLVGINAMELLINALVREGVDRRNLVAKVFGGAQMFNGLSGIGAANGRFVVGYLKREDIPIVGQSLGGRAARQLMYWPANGRVLLKAVDVPGQTGVDMKGPARGNGPERF